MNKVTMQASPKNLTFPAYNLTLPAYNLTFSAYITLHLKPITCIYLGLQVNESDLINRPTCEHRVVTLL